MKIDKKKYLNEMKIGCENTFHFLEIQIKIGKSEKGTEYNNGCQAKIFIPSVE